MARTARQRQMDVTLRTCTECGMLLDTPGEFHPQAFCVWKKAGLDPWATLVWVNTRLGLHTAHWPKKPPLVRDLPSDALARKQS